MQFAAHHPAAPPPLEQVPTTTPAGDESTDIDLDKLRAKYKRVSGSGGGPGGGYSGAHPALSAARSASSSRAGTSMTPEEIAAYERLGRHKICPACGGTGQRRMHISQFCHTDVDCEKCGGEG